jgi:hypothetical protein
LKTFADDVEWTLTNENFEIFAWWIQWIENNWELFDVLLSISDQSKSDPIHESKT